jgi:hypothetical protein
MRHLRRDERVFVGFITQILTSAWEKPMLKTIIALPQEIGGKVRIQSADERAQEYLCWRGFRPETLAFGGWHVMRRDFHDTAFGHYPEPLPPRFLIHVL